MSRKIQSGRLLWTRNGRRLGNAIVVGPAEREDTWLCETDFGNQMRLTCPEIDELYHRGPRTYVARWYADREELRCRS
jgi:hypothetical protein